MAAGRQPCCKGGVPRVAETSAPPALPPRSPRAQLARLPSAKARLAITFINQQGLQARAWWLAARGAGGPSQSAQRASLQSPWLWYNASARTPHHTDQLQEAGIDMGGLMKEFLESVATAGLDPNRGLFAATPDGAAYPHPLAGAWATGAAPARWQRWAVGGWFRWRRRAGPHSHSIPSTRSHRAPTPARPTAPAAPVQRAWTAGWLHWRHWAACWGGRCTRGCCWRHRWHPSLWRACRWAVWCGAF